MIFISVDDHVVEPPDMFEGRMPAKYADLAPRIVRNSNGDDVWVFDGKKIPNIGLNAVAGRPKEEYGVDPTSFDEMRPGCFDVHERVKDMSAGGVLASMNFPSFPSFSGRLFLGTDDKDLAQAVVRAYNDWHIDGLVRRLPRPLHPDGHPDAVGPGAHRRRRSAGSRRRAATRSPSPRTPPPSACRASTATTGTRCGRRSSTPSTILNIHLGSSGQLGHHRARRADRRDDHAAAAEHLPGRRRPAVVAGHQGVPALRIALSEGGTGWIPYFMDRLDRTYDMHRAWTGQDFDDKLPSEVFREHFMTCFIADPIGLALRQDIGIENICWEMDYPHSDSSWPNAPEEFAAACAKYGVTDAEIDKITHENAMKWYQFDPYAIRPREQCTVGALRAEVAGHDVSIKAFDTGRFEKSKADLVELQAKATA